LRRHKTRYHKSTTYSQPSNAKIPETSNILTVEVLDSNDKSENIENPHSNLQSSNISGKEEQTNGTLHDINENEDHPADDIEISQQNDKSLEEINNDSTQLGDISTSSSDVSISSTKEKKKTAIVAPLKPEESNAKIILQCEKCNFIGKTTPGLKRHKSTAHKLSLRNRKKAKTLKIQTKMNQNSETENVLDLENADNNEIDQERHKTTAQKLSLKTRKKAKTLKIQTKISQNSETENILDLIHVNADNNEIDQESNPSSRDSSFNSYSTALPADYLKYIYL